MNVSSGFLAVASAVGFTQMVVLTLLYGLRSDWRSSPAGLVLLGSFAIKAVIFGMLLAGRLVGPLGVVPWAVAVTVFDLVQFAWLWLVLREQAARRGNKAEDTSRSASDRPSL